MAIFIKKSDWGDFPANSPLDKEKLKMKSLDMLAIMGISLDEKTIPEFPESFRNLSDLDTL